MLPRRHRRECPRNGYLLVITHRWWRERHRFLWCDIRAARHGRVYTVHSPTAKVSLHDEKMDEILFR